MDRESLAVWVRCSIQYSSICGSILYGIMLLQYPAHVIHSQYVRLIENNNKQKLSSNVISAL